MGQLPTNDIPKNNAAINQARKTNEVKPHIMNTKVIVIDGEELEVPADQPKKED